MSEVIYLSDILKKNGDRLVHYDEAKQGKKYMSVFNYSVKNGGAVDSHKYYNEYYIELESK